MMGRKPRGFAYTGSIPIRQRLLTVAILCAGSAIVAATTWAVEIDGFTEPYRSVDVAAAEIGIIAEMKVREGDAVRKGQVLATLDNELQRALLAIAQKSVESRGQLESALAELALRQQRLEKLESLLAKGHARHEEIERARADVAVAEAHVLSAREEQAIRKLEHQKIAVQLKRRTVLAPIDGVVTVIHKDEGEYVAPTDPCILNIVQLDRLCATFSVPSAYRKTFKIGDRIPLQLCPEATRVDGVLEYIAPVTDAESGTVRIKFRVDNTDGVYRGGQRCLLELPDRTTGSAVRLPPRPTRSNIRTSFLPADIRPSTSLSINGPHSMGNMSWK